MKHESSPDNRRNFSDHDLDRLLAEAPPAPSAAFDQRVADWIDGLGEKPSRNLIRFPSWLLAAAAALTVTTAVLVLGPQSGTTETVANRNPSAAVEDSLTGDSAPVSAPDAPIVIDEEVFALIDLLEDIDSEILEEPSADTFSSAT